MENMLIIYLTTDWLQILHKILITADKWIEYQNGMHKIFIPSKSCEGVLSLDSLSNIQQEYRQIIGRVLRTQF